MKIAGRISLVTAAALVSSVLPAHAQVTEFDCARAGVDDKCETWVATYDDNEVAELASESPADVAVSPDGAFVYSAMRMTVGTGFDAKSRWAILAHDNDGQLIWLARWGSPDVHSFPTSIAVSRDGDLVLVSGSWRTDQVAADGHLTTIAFDADDGDIVWTANYDGPGNGTDNARDLVVSPDGRTVYIAGISAGRDNSDLDYAVVAYDVGSGRELWVTRWDGIGKGNSDSPFAIDVNSRGDMLYLTGWSYGEGEFNNDYGTIAVDISGDDAGRIVWSARYDGVGVRAPDLASALTVSPDDKTVFVTGMSDDVEGGPPFEVNYGFATVAYDALSGAQLWESRKQWPESRFNAPNALTVDPSGRRLVVTGQAGLGELDFGTVAYDPQNGEEVWSDRYGLEEYDFEFAKEAVMDPRGDTVYVTGVSAKSPPGTSGVVLYAPNADQLTIAYDVMTGQKRWLARFNPSVTDYVSTQSMAISPDATKIYLAASIDDQNWDNDGDDVDAGIIAYEIGAGIPIPPPPATLEFSDSSDTRGQYSDETTIEARLTEPSGAPIAGAELTLQFPDRVTSAVTDTQGLAAITYTLDQPPGEYVFGVTYEGDDEHGPARLDGVYTIEAEDTDLLLEVDRKDRTLKALLRDQDSSVGISEREVVFYYKDEIIGRTATDGSGVGELRDVAEAGRSSNHLRVVFEGDPFFRSSAAP
ncbi:MAG: PQQ-binding-like beta-propeller repeat protein [Actinomycetota bacterium]